MNTIYDILYNVCGLAGAVAVALLISFLRKKDRLLDRVILILCYIASIIGFFIGAHLLFFLEKLPAFSENYGMMIVDLPSFFDAVFNAASGMAFYGGLFGASAAVLILCKIRHIYARPYLNVCACSFPLLLAFGRIGCTLFGCCYGIEYHGIFALTYSADHIVPGKSDHIADFPHFPVQLLESLLMFILCFVLVQMYLKFRDKYPLLSIYFISYGIIRFFDELLRSTEAKTFQGPLSTSQWIALISLAITAGYLITIKKKKMI